MASLSHTIARRWVVGPTIENAIHAAHLSQSHGVKPLINFIGEHSKNTLKAEKATQTYLSLTHALDESATKADLSVKLTQLGLDMGKGYCLENVLKIVEATPGTVWLDMEAFPYIQDTIDIFLDILEEHKNVAVTLQANRKRTRHDLLTILKRRGRVRLVKGAYKGYYKDHDAIAFNFSRLMRMLFHKGHGFALGTGDEDLTTEALLLKYRYTTEFEFQFLHGMNEQLKTSLLKKDMNIADYITFGNDALPYVWRRVKDSSHLFG